MMDEPKPLYAGSPVPAKEIEAAAVALQLLWESEENQRALRETGHGASFLYQAQLALEAALRAKNGIWWQVDDF